MAELAIEVWSSLCQAEEERNLKNVQFNSIVLPHSESIINLLLLAISKIDASLEDKDSTSENEKNLYSQAGNAL